MEDETADENYRQIEMEFPSPDNFPSYDEIDSEQGQSELGEMSYSASAANDKDSEEGCCP